MTEADGSFWSRWRMPVLFVVIVSLVLASGYASYVFVFTSQASIDAGTTAQEGDAVSVQYIGMFEDGTVFDTSMESVAENDTQYPKSLSFSTRINYTPLNFTIGSGQMIKGFENGVTGMAVNQTRILYIPPSEGYGESDPTKIVTRESSEMVPVFEWFGNTSEFLDTFMMQPVPGANLKNLKYGWNMTVFYVDGTTGQVLLRNEPCPGEIVTQDGYWSSKIISIDSAANMGMGEITLRHLVSEELINTKLFTDETGNQFTVTGIDVNAGTFTIDYNREVVGRTLVFKITLVSLTPAP